ncbi:lipid-A-disaccharide synthase [Myxacorys almedinensis]|uniref:Lipid-A-disaccharide synthase n=1 Tax=Myxacorys almedinensis A TaxID=2690445 RepID=A0A8J7Z4A6_9CYAN|nr:lipid-A-disaccharide synthase [Myxacorys almedinensis]NDJ19494.1 lipid-A-disaccharide synthase [Myxacorys almedinensis A]
MSSAIDILILSNAPGELATWVKPVVRELRVLLGQGDAVRISVILSPCPNASGQEAAIARSYPEVDRVQAADQFFPFLLFGKTAENWQWRDRGVVIFLGGDQFFPVVIGKRLGYRTVIYAEWEARWHRWIDRFAVMRADIANRVPKPYAHKVTVVGDLMAEVGAYAQQDAPANLVGLLPGSKPAKLAQGVPFLAAIAECIHAQRPETRFIVPVAPTLDLPTLARYGDPAQNPIVARMGNISLKLVMSASGHAHLETQNGVQIELKINPVERMPAYDVLSKCCLCLTTVGANTAELGALAVPMIVLLPTQQLDAMRSWDGLPGLLVNLPGVGSTFAKIVNGLALRRLGLLAWPNIWAKEMIVPELVGNLQAKEVAALAIDYLDHPEKRHQMQEKLRQLRGAPGAATKLAKIVQDEIRYLEA